MRTANVHNDIYNRMTIGAPEPEVGMGATITHWTDRDAGTVIGWDGDIIAIQEDEAKRTDGYGMSDVQSYEYSADPNGRVWYFRRDKSNAWRFVTRNEKTGRWNIAKSGPGLVLGFRRKYYDYSF